MKLINVDTARRIIDSPRNKTQMLNMLEQTPIVEIIRCKDCKHRYIEAETWHCPFGLMGGENFYCGYGRLGKAERRQDG